MPPKTILSEERVQDSSDSERSTPEPMQTLRDGADSISKSASEAQVDRISDTEQSDTDSRSQGSSSPDDSQSSTSSTGSKRKATETPKETFESPLKRVKKGDSTVKRIESTTYVPPQGYSTTDMNKSGNSSKAGEMFADLDGKQVWHITTPSTISMNQIRSLDIEAGLKGAAALVHANTTYTLARSTVENVALLLPTGKDGAYASARPTISRAFHVQESSKSPSNDPEGGNGPPISELANGSFSFFATQSGQLKPPRQQPPNLKNRYIPFGVSTSKQDDDINQVPPLEVTSSIVESATAVSEDRETPAEQMPAKQKKRKAKAVRTSNNDMDVDETLEQHKKASQTSATIEEPSTQDGSQKKKKRKEKSKKETA